MTTLRTAAQALYSACCNYGSQREQDIRDAAKALGAALAADSTFADTEGCFTATIADRLSIVADMLAEGFQPRMPAEPAAIQLAAMECRKVAAELEAAPAADVVEVVAYIVHESVDVGVGVDSESSLRWEIQEHDDNYEPLVTESDHLAATAALQAALKASEETKQTIADLAEANNRSKLQRIAELQEQLSHVELGADERLVDLEAAQAELQPALERIAELEARQVPESTRGDFETWFADSRRNRGAAKRPTFERLEDGTYADDHTQRHWWTWQCALSPSKPTGGAQELIQRGRDEAKQEQSK